jgi:hypothetical protein
VGASVVTSVDAPPILEFAEHVLDFVAAAVEHLVVRDGHFSIGLGRDTGGDTAIGQGMAKPVGIVPFIAQQECGLGKGLDQ